MPALKPIDEFHDGLNELCGIFPVHKSSRYMELVPSSASSSTSTTVTSTASTPATTPAETPEASILSDAKLVSPRNVQRNLTWEEMWAAWPVLTAQQVASAQRCRHPLEVMPWTENKELYGNVINFDAPLVVYPPRRTSYTLLSPWTLAKLQVDRGMHLHIIRSIYELSFGSACETKWRAVWKMLQSWQPSWDTRVARIKAASRRANEHMRAREVVAALVQYANAWMYTLPWFPEAGSPHDSIFKAAPNWATGILALIANTAAYACTFTPESAKSYERIAQIGYTAAKAVLWRADQHTVGQVQMACDAAVLLDACLTTKSPGRTELVIMWRDQSAMLKDSPNNIDFHEVPDHLRTPFFQYNARNEHYTSW